VQAQDQVQGRETVQREGASFRDPSGHVYLLGDRVLRSVSRAAAADYVFVRDSGLLDDLAREGQAVATKEVAPALLGAAEPPAYLLEHPKLAYISYPYEWSFSALKAAALLQLDIHLKALERGVTLSDASAYNIQFIGSRPVFIDVLSFVRYEEGAFWSAHRQFCEQYLNPLLLTARRGVAFNAWFRGSLEGIPTEDLNRLLSWRDKLSWNVFTHVCLQAKLQSAAQASKKDDLEVVKKGRLSKAAFRNMLTALRQWIAGMTPPGRSTTWGDYADKNSYSDNEGAAKRRFVADFVDDVRPQLLWDIGCNSGDYSALAIESGARQVVGFDFDLMALDAAFARATAKDLPYLPLYLDAANPSPGQGWRGLERKSLGQRAKADAIVALAFIHHMAIGRNIPLDDVIDWLIGLAPQGVIEFVEKSDPTTQQMLQFRADIFDGYNLTAFREAVTRRAEIVAEAVVTDDRRRLIWYRRKA